MVLGSQADKPLASEAEAEALRDGVAEANAQTEVIESKPNNPHLLADAFPITFTLNDTDYTVSDGDSRLSFSGSSEFTMFMDGYGVCDFKSDNTFRSAWLQAENLKFNGRDPVEGVWPVLHFAVSDVKVRDVSVLMKSAVVPPSASATTGQAADAKATGDALVTITPDWVQTSAYAAYDCVKYNNAYYYAKTDIAANTAWNANNWGSLANLAAILHKFLPLSGGTMTGDIAMGTNVVQLGNYASMRGDNTDKNIVFKDLDLELESRLLPDGSRVVTLHKIAPDFSENDTYAQNALCVHNGVLYRCTTAVTTPEEWTAAHWTEATVQDVFANLSEVARTGSYTNLLNKPTINGETVNGNKTSGDYNLIGTDNIGGYLADYALMTTIADEFSYNTHYAVGDLCIYMGASETTYTLYKCTTAHHGTWNASHFESATVEDVLAALRTGKANKVANATAGNLAALDASGNPTDSTIPAANVATKGNIPYDLIAKTIANGAVTLDDRAINAVAVSSSLASLTVNFPPATSGKARDFGLRLTVASGITTAPELALPQGVTCENADGEAPEIGADGAATILYFTETASGVFLVKGEVLQTITA